MVMDEIPEGCQNPFASSRSPHQKTNAGAMKAPDDIYPQNRRLGKVKSGRLANTEESVRPQLLVEMICPGCAVASRRPAARATTNVQPLLIKMTHPISETLLAPQTRP